MSHIMLDLETLSLEPDAAIVSIGAVEFFPEDPDSSLGARFYQVVDLSKSGTLVGHIDPGTVSWWMLQSNKAREVFDVAGAPLAEALLGFTDYVHICARAEEVFIWGDGAANDNVWLTSAYRRCGIPLPWKYSGNMCYRTMRQLHLNVEFEKFGVAHNALDDAIAQAEHLLKIFKSMR